MFSHIRERVSGRILVLFATETDWMFIDGLEKIHVSSTEAQSLQSEPSVNSNKMTMPQFLTFASQLASMCWVSIVHGSKLPLLLVSLETVCTKWVWVAARLWPFATRCEFLLSLVKEAARFAQRQFVHVSEWNPESNLLPNLRDVDTEFGVSWLWTIWH